MNLEGNETLEMILGTTFKDTEIECCIVTSPEVKRVNIKETKKSYDDYKNENNINAEEDLMDKYENRTPDTWKIEHVGMDLKDDHIKNTQTIEN